MRDKTNANFCVTHSSSRAIRQTAFAALIGLALTAGCAATSVPPQPLDPPAGVEEFSARRLDDPALKAFLETHDRAPAAWPLPEWSYDDLALAALHFRADYRVAEAEVLLAERQRERDVQAANPQLGMKVERSNDPAARSPWTVAIELNFLLQSANRRAASAALADLRVQQARLKSADTAWRRRGDVRDRALDLAYAREELALREQARALADGELGMLEKRVTLGAAAQSELLPVLRLARQNALARAEAKAQAAAAADALAAAIGVPAEAVRGVSLRGDSAARDIDFATYQRNALQRRHDIRRALLDYAEAEASLVLDTTLQQDVAIAPGIKWDQGANVWSLASALLLPLLHDNRATVAAAVAQRQVVARRFAAAQQQALADIHAAWADWQGRQALTAAAHAAQAAEQRNVAVAESRYQRGMIDRLERVRGQTLYVEARQRQLQIERDLARARARLEDAAQWPLAVPGVGVAAGMPGIAGMPGMPGTTERSEP